MTKPVPVLLVALGLTLPALPCIGAGIGPVVELQPDAPQVQDAKAKLPRLGVDVANDMPTTIKADFNGDGWCDYALGVHYPLNSRMNSYTLDELMALGRPRGWKPVFNGKKSWEMDEQETWPTFRVDLTGIRLVFPKQPGAPYVSDCTRDGTMGRVTWAMAAGSISRCIAGTMPSVHSRRATTRRGMRS
jgi:hypothetical protein